MKALIQVLLFVLPWKIRRYSLIWFWGFKIHPKARIGFSIILAKKLIMEKSSLIGSLTICKRIDLLHCKEESQIGTSNFITGFASREIDAFSHRVNRKCELVLERHAHITSRHFLDCNGGIYIGEFTTFAGIRSQIMTHSIDPYLNRQDAEPIYIGKYCFVGTGCILLKGSRLPDYSILGAGSVLNKAYSDTGFVYAGAPARPVKKLNIDELKFFNRQNGFVL